MTRKRNYRPQYRLRLQSGRCLTYYETGEHKHKAQRGDLVLAIYGDLRHAEAYCSRYNAEWAWLGLKATIWAYFGTKPAYEVTNGSKMVTVIEERSC